MRSREKNIYNSVVRGRRRGRKWQKKKKRNCLKKQKMNEKKINEARKKVRMIWQEEGEENRREN